MQHSIQHIEAIKQSIRIKDEVSCEIFSDKVKRMGTVTVSGGVITVKLEYLPGLVNGEVTRDFIVAGIGLALAECYNRKPNAFDPFSPSTAFEIGALK